MTEARQDDFYAGVPVFAGFASLMDPGLYKPLPDDWLVGLTDVVASTRAIEAGRYKAVNTAGAAAIAAIANALGTQAFPFAFGGDGASFALAPEHAARAQEALAATTAWVRDDLDLTLRAALVPVSAIRGEGVDVRVARFAASPHVDYAMFSGGGIAWATAAMKRGAFAVEPAPPGIRPDLTGLSCRWREMAATRGVVLSVIVLPAAGETSEAFGQLVGTLLALAADPAEAGRPLPDTGLHLSWPPAGLEIEARASRRPRGSLALRRLMLAAETLAAFLVFRFGLRVGGFDPARYCAELVENADFRKYEDGLRLTLDCTPALADRIEALLVAAEEAGIADYGIHRQAAAMMTCFVPSPLRSDHVHFIDGATGGYAAAAARLKRARRLPREPGGGAC